MSLDRAKIVRGAASEAAARARAPAQRRPRAIPAGVLPDLLTLQQEAGNTAVTELLTGQRPGSPLALAPSGPVGAELPVQRSELPRNYEFMADFERAGVIRDLLKYNPAGVYQAWKGLRDPKAVAQGRPDLFTASMKVDDDIVDLPAFDSMRADFRNDVENQARVYLRDNKQLVLAERARTGVPEKGETPEGRADILAGAGGSAEADFAVQEVQKAAGEMARIKDGKSRCLVTTVGFDYGTTKGGFPVKNRKSFDPGHPPRYPDPPAPTYTDVMTQWSKLIAAEAGIVRRHPSAAFFIGEGGDPGQIRQDKDIRVARTEIARALADLEGRIDKAIPLIGDDIKFTDLVPIQQQLLGGMRGLSGTVWSTPVEKAVARETIADANIRKLLITLGVGTLSAAFFIFASIASGGTFAGLAPYLFAAGAGTSAGQAAASWKTYTDLAAANRAAINPEEQLVSGEQVEAAMVSAILDTVFAALDAWQGVKGVKAAVAAAEAGGKAMLVGGKAGAGAGAAALLRNIRGADNPAAALASAVAEVGPEEARRISGLAFDDLAGIAGEQTDLGKRFLMLAEKGSGAMSEETTALVGKLPRIGDLEAAEGEKVLAAGISQFGYKGVLEKVGGWKALKPVLGAGGGSAAAMESWRKGIFVELRRFIEQESGRSSRAVRTGTEAAASDLDVQILGEAASELESRAEGWLAGRLGTDVERAKLLLNAEVFIDPTRAHLVDLMRDLGADVRAQIQGRMTTYEQQMIFGARLKEAEKAGQSFVDKVMAEARQAGVEPFTGFERLTPATQKEYAALIDGWMNELKDPANASRRAELVEKISKTQAHINASHPDAYVGGGVALWVSGRDLDANKIAEALNVDPSDLAKVTTAKRISAALSEGKWLDAAVQQIRQGPWGTFEDLAKAVSDIGKHGARAAQVLRVPGKTNVARLEMLMDVLRTYKGTTVAELKQTVRSGQLAALRTEIARILDHLSSETGAAVSVLQKDAGALGVSIAEMADFQAWLKWQARFQALTSGAAEATAAHVRLVETALQAGEQASYMEPGGVPEYPLPVPMSVPPGQ